MVLPNQVPHVFIRWLTEPGDVVYDPFAGRGWRQATARVGSADALAAGAAVRLGPA